MTNGMLSVLDTTHNVALLLPTQPLIAAITPSRVQPVMTLVPRQEGFDLQLEFNNQNGSTAMGVPPITLGGWQLGTWVGWRDFRYEGTLLTLSGGAPPTQNSTYPASLYSPVAVLSNAVAGGTSQYTIGVSVDYPLAQSGQQARFQLLNNGSSGRNIEIDVDPVPAGTLFEMTVSVRIIGGAENWIRSLVSYRDYFRCMYGSVQYTRDTRPVQGYVTTQVSALGTASPYGFRWDKSKNPDVAGWSPFVTQDLSTAPARGYQRTMIWTPTGLYQTYSYNPPLGITTVQYPFQFMTQNDAVPAMASTLYAFSKLPPGLSLGFWWGTSLSLRRTWNSPPSSVEELDPSRADHQLIAFYELDYARRLGATLIGLDSFGWTGPQVLTWIDLMRAHAPEVTFIPEHSWDVLHARVPMWRDGISLTTPPVLADFLLPGHETWCSLVPANFSNESNAVAAEAQRLASMGCTIVMYDEVAMPAGITTAASWETTIPADLR